MTLDWLPVKTMLLDRGPQGPPTPGVAPAPQRACCCREVCPLLELRPPVHQMSEIRHLVHPHVHFFSSPQEPCVERGCLRCGLLSRSRPQSRSPTGHGHKGPRTTGHRRARGFHTARLPAASRCPAPPGRCAGQGAWMGDAQTPRSLCPGSRLSEALPRDLNCTYRLLYTRSIF